MNYLATWLNRTVNQSAIMKKKKIHLEKHRELDGGERAEQQEQSELEGGQVEEVEILLEPVERREEPEQPVWRSECCEVCEVAEREEEKERADGGGEKERDREGQVRKEGPSERRSFTHNERRADVEEGARREDDRVLQAAQSVLVEIEQIRVRDVPAFI